MQHRTGGKLFNLTGQKGVTKTQTDWIRELLFAGDTAPVAHTKGQTQTLVDAFAAASNKMGLQTNTSKTELLYQPLPNNMSPEDP